MSCSGSILEASAVGYATTVSATERDVHRMTPRVGLASESTLVVMSASYIFPGSLYKCHFDGSATHHDGERNYSYTANAVVTSRDRLSCMTPGGSSTMHPFNATVTVTSNFGEIWKAGNFYFLPVFSARAFGAHHFPPFCPMVLAALARDGRPLLTPLLVTLSDRC